MSKTSEAAGPPKDAPIKKRKCSKRAPKLKLDVTQAIIDASCRRDSSHCMLADAIEVAVPEAKNISVDLQTIRFSIPRTRLRYVYLTPRPCQVAIVEFDQGSPVQPFTVRLRGGQVTPMNASHRSGGRPSRAGTSKRQKVQNMVPSDGNCVPNTTASKAPPLQKTKGSDIPFARRREFGVRQLMR
jgi:hypothetical protein